MPKHLNLDVARALHQPLQVDRAVAERALGHGLGGADHIGELGRIVHLPHPDAAAAGRRLHQQREANVLGSILEAGRVVRSEPRAAGDDREPSVAGDGAGALLVAHGGDALCRRPDPDEAGVLHGLRKRRILGEETVARMDRIGAALSRGRDDLVGDEIALLGGRRPNRQRLVGLSDMPGVGIGFRIDRDRRDAERPRASHDPAGDLAPVRDQELLHGHRARGRPRGVVSSRARQPGERLPAPSGGRKRRTAPNRASTGA